MKTLPDRIFFVGAPGSHWSGISQDLESIPGFNTTDRRPENTYRHKSQPSGHVGTYFGTGLEFGISLESSNLDAPYAHTQGTRLHRCHEWAYHLDEIRDRYPTAWIILVYRPDLDCYRWWQQAGGFDIAYPDYRPYFRDNENLFMEIQKMNSNILEFGKKYNIFWRHLSSAWYLDTFGFLKKSSVTLADVLIGCYKPKKSL